MIMQSNLSLKQIRNYAFDAQTEFNIVQDLAEAYKYLVKELDEVRASYRKSEERFKKDVKIKQDLKDRVILLETHIVKEFVSFQVILVVHYSVFKANMLNENANSSGIRERFRLTAADQLLKHSDKDMERKVHGQATVGNRLVFPVTLLKLSNENRAASL